MKNLGTVLRQIATYTLYVVSGLVPVFFLPTTTEFFDINKRTLIFAAAIVLALCFAAYGVTRKMIRITLSPALISVVIFAISMLLSTFIATPYAYEALLGRTLLILSLTAIFIAGSTLAKAQSGKPFLYVLSLSGAVVSVVSILQSVGWGPSHLLNMISGLSVPHNALFNIVGSGLIAILFLAPVLAANLVELFATTDSKQKAVHGVISAVLILGVVVNLYFMLPGKIAQLVFPPFQASWSIAIDAMKTPRSAFLGVGPESYSVAFASFRPADLNLTDYWNVQFPDARVELLQVLTTTGIVGLAAWLLMAAVSVFLSFPFREESRGLSIILFTSLLLQLVFPSNLVLTALFYLTLTVLVLVRKAHKDSRISDVLLQLSAIKIVAPESNEKVERSASGALATIIGVILLAVSGFAVYEVGKAYASENMFYRSLLAIQKDDVSTAYSLQQNVIRYSPLSDRYRRAFASTNFAIANAISQNEQATEEQRGTVAPLVQEAVSQAKTATDIDARKTANWQNLAGIYRSLIGSVEGADQFTIAALVRTIQTNPTDPTLRFELGSVYSSLQNFEQAIRLFQQTIELKPDWANAYYNLANAYKQRGDNATALTVLQQTVQLLPADSEDRATLQAEITELQKTVDASAKQTPAATGTQTTGTQGTTPTEQIRLPENLGLPEATPPTTIPDQPEATPTPTPEPTPEPSPSATPTP